MYVKKDSFNRSFQPIKTTQLDNTFSSAPEQITHSPSSEKKGVTAVVATVRSGPELRPQAKKIKFGTKTSSKKVPKQKIFRILLYLIVDPMVTYCFIKRNSQKLPLFD